jgi:hypothetical protein
VFNFTEEIMNNQGKDHPVECKPGKKKWGGVSGSWCKKLIKGITGKFCYV